MPRSELTFNTYRETGAGPLTIGDVTFTRELRLDSEDIGPAFYVQLPLTGRYESRHRGVDTIVSRHSSAVYVPEGGRFAGRWPAGYRALCVRVEQSAVETALAGLAGDHTGHRVAFSPVMDTQHGYGRSWAELLFFIHRQLALPRGLMGHALTAAPLMDSVLSGFVLAAGGANIGSLVGQVAAARPAAVRTAIELMEADPQAPLTVSLLAARCGVGSRTLQKGFQQHLQMSPMEYLRDVRLRCAHEELRAADPYAESVATVARRWGFNHLGRFAAAHEAKYGEKPLRTLRG
ncbi:AraC family transcriptional regulator [Kribbella sp. NPDC051620]|uniref:AraC family transcriptional regulator n=1 Tax=Kribbella sp. NPDC051620 TaxID=3364120 RepID=UPI00378C4CB4